MAVDHPPDRTTQFDDATRTLVAVDRVSRYYRSETTLFADSSALVPAVIGVTLKVRRGETLALVGESGSGKTTLGRIMLRLVEPSFGRVFFDGQDITSMRARDLRPLRKRMQLVFQDPHGTLNPRLSILETLSEGPRIHRLTQGAKSDRARAASLLSDVGMGPDALERYPHEFSGGQRQRIAIARALSVEPEFVVCDEPVSALDVSVQAQILNLLVELQERRGLTYLFISHDLLVVRHIAHRIAVMYRGALVEVGAARTLFSSARHPYTQSLIDAIPTGERRTARGSPLSRSGAGKAPPESGCRYFHLCARRIQGTCDTQVPPLSRTDVPDHRVACHAPLSPRPMVTPASP